MSILAYTGLPGSGKSYSVVEHQILPALKAGRRVVTNVPLRMDAIAALSLPGTVVEFPVSSVAAEPHLIREYVSAGSVFVLDEVWRLFPQGQQANKVPDEYKSLLAEHRHMVDARGNSTQIVFVVQDLANIGAFARRLVESTFVTTKLSFVGLSGSYRVDIFHGAVTGATPPVSNRLRMITGRYRKEIFDLYQSHTMAVDGGDGGAANEAKIDPRANILRRPVFIVGAVAIPILVYGAWHVLGGVVQRTKEGKEAFGLHKATSSIAAPVPGAPPPAVGAAPPSGPRLLLSTVLQGKMVVLLSDGLRLHWLDATDCLGWGRNLQCKFHAIWIDSAGPLPDESANPSKVN